MKKIISLILVTVLLFALVGCSNTKVIYDGEAELESQNVFDTGDVDTAVVALYFNTDCLGEKADIPLSNVTITLTLVDSNENILEIRVYSFPYIEPYQNYFVGYYYDDDIVDDAYMKIVAKSERGKVINALFPDNYTYMYNICIQIRSFERGDDNGN